MQTISGEIRKVMTDDERQAAYEILQAVRDHFGANLTLAREEVGLELEELASRMDVKPHRLADYERGRILPDWGTVFRLADALERHWTWFFGLHNQAA